jgi:hypothetical protein
VIVHGGNGRMPHLVALQLNLPPEKIWSQTSVTGNLGSASLPVAWAMRTSPPTPSPTRGGGSGEGLLPGPVAWTSVGAGLTWAAALTGDLSPG